MRKARWSFSSFPPTASWSLAARWRSEPSARPAHCRRMADILSWAATATTILAALMTASNLGSRVTGYGFAVFTIGALCWLIVGAMSHQPALLWTNAVLLAVDLFGVWRWLGRQAKGEGGARAGAQARGAGPGGSVVHI